MSVKVNDVIGVAGFVVPGSKVDVVVNIRRPNDTMTRTAASNVQVLTAGTRQDQARPEAEKEKDKKPAANASTVVTLMVSPEDAERIALAATEGSIMLAMRNPLDATTTETKGTRLASLMGAPDPAPVVRVAKGVPKAAIPAPAPPPPPAIYQVETIRAAKRLSEVVK